MGRAGVRKRELAGTTGMLPRVPWSAVEDFELATFGWVHWWNLQDLREPIGYVPSAELEASWWWANASIKPGAILRPSTAAIRPRWTTCDSMVRMAIPVDLRAALDGTSGTVTSFLEQLVGERIDAHARGHETIGASTANDLQVEEDHPLLHRAATLRGRTSGRSYVYAESIIVTSRLPPGFSDRLEFSRDPIGRILDEMGIAVTREDLVEPVAASRPRNAEVGIGEYLLVRSYRLDSEQIPLMLITEWFLLTVMPFLPLTQ
jgi:chorismate-pyruvate lyase